MLTHKRTQEPLENPYSKVGDNTIGLSAEITGWDLVRTLYSIGLDNPGKLARLLEEEDPFKVKANDVGTTGLWNYSICGTHFHLPGYFLAAPNNPSLPEY